jgi:EAL domain-containing protein (putative c-di-GMP-specific phosphodiesterase class I)
MDAINLDSREKRALKNAFRRLLPALLVIIFVFVTAISYFHFLEERRFIVDSQQDMILAAEMDYNNYITHLTSIVHSIEINYIELVARGESGQVGDLFINAMEENPTIDQLRVLDPDGMEIVRVNKGIPTPYVVPEDELQNKADRYYYTETKMLGRNQFLFSALDLNVENDEIEIDPYTGLTKPTFRISTPIVMNEERIGYFVVNFLMRDYLSDLRTLGDMPGETTLLLDQNGYMLNYNEEEYNFGFSYPEGSEEYGRTVESLFPQIDLSAESGSFFGDDRICSYSVYTNISDLSKDYVLSENASEQLYFMVCFDGRSAYGAYMDYSFLQNVLDTWPLQLGIILLLVSAYFILIFLLFLNNRARFTNNFLDEGYRKVQLKKAIRNHEFVNYYQPIINIQDGTIMGFEALARWEKPDTVLTPDKFLEQINNFELGIALDENIFQNIRFDRKKLEELGLMGNAFISINISRTTFEDMARENSHNAIKLTDEEKEYIVFELLEDIIFHRKAAEKVRELDRQNVRFAIDDFGTGNSNIVFIRSFENMQIKIDKAFVPKDVHNPQECIIMEAFVKMFVDKGLKLIVEGVETKEQYLYLKELKVPGVQGYYFSKPLSLDQVIEFLIKKEYLKKM